MNLVYDALFRAIPGVKRKGGSGSWANFNAICCTYNGEVRPDTRNRGGLILASDNSCSYHCFNCKYKASWKPGQKLSRKMESLLDWAHLSLEEQKRLKFKVWQLWMNGKSDKPVDNSLYVPKAKFSFKEMPLPNGAQPFSYWLKPENFREEFVPVAQYMMERGTDLFDSYDFHWTPEPETFPDGKPDTSIIHRVLIPFRWEGKIVGYTGRDTSGTLKHRYYGKVLPNYIFNTESIDHDNEYVFVCEGSFDALAINGVALLGDKITPEQADWLDDTGKKIVVVCDREKAGGRLVDMAVERGWYVSFPDWGDNLDIKDAAQAVRELGKIYTMLSITGAMFNDKFAIGVRRKLAFRKAKNKYVR